jgi:zinc D-Ala-D-Ala dipeptidase
MDKMNLSIICFLLLTLICIDSYARTSAQETSFVCLKSIDPSIQQDIRYAASHNFVGRPIAGYQAAECILTRPAAQALTKVQNELRKLSLSLKVYDCYRPKMAVQDFIIWSKQDNQQQMKQEFYPRVDKKDFFKLGYVAEKSSHSRGSTVDVTIVPLGSKEASYNSTQELLTCYAPYHKRFPDNSIDMGTGFDCMDELSHALNPNINSEAHKNRLFLRQIMQKYGFAPYAQEWWHFTLKNEPYKDTYFNFPISHLPL